jgi:hypothetical protein
MANTYYAYIISSAKQQPKTVAINAFGGFVGINNAVSTLAE